MKITVIVRNDIPFIFYGDAPSYRSVQIELTPEQIDKLKLKVVGVNCGKEVREAYSKCFIEI